MNKYNIAILSQKLLLKGRMINNDTTLNSLNLTPKDMFILFIFTKKNRLVNSTTTNTQSTQSDSTQLNNHQSNNTDIIVNDDPISGDKVDTADTEDQKYIDNDTMVDAHQFEKKMILIMQLMTKTIMI